MTSPELARLLERHREEINAAFHGQAALRAPERIGDFLSSFRLLAESAVGSISRSPGLKEAAGPAIEALFRVWLGSWEKATADSERALTSLIESFPGPLAQDPERFLRSSLNAMETLAGSSEGSLEKWQVAMSRVGGFVPSLDEYLKVGLAAAWLSGLAQYRQAALRELASLPPRASAALFNLETKGSTMEPPRLAETLASDPWSDPAVAANGGRRERSCLSSTGGWRGYGGQFNSPPVLWNDVGAVVASDGSGSFRVYADRWGSALVGEPGLEPEKTKGSQAAGFRLDDKGFIMNDLTCRWDEIEALGHGPPRFAGADLTPSSSAALGNTVFFTHPLSFRIYIIGLPA